jgi:hypothetical protein
MSCSQQTEELVECARRGMEPGAALRSHLAACLGCRERWDIERQLAGHLGIMRRCAQARQTPAVRRDARREDLMREFARTRTAQLRSRKAGPSWGWTLAAAAALVVAAFIGHEWGVRTRPPVTPAVRTHGVQQAGAILYEASTDASALSSDDFVAVPYAPPLAPGELIRVLRANLYPQALASMGIDVDPASEETIPAYVVVGGDGLPRAVRIVDVSDF